MMTYRHLRNLSVTLTLKIWMKFVKVCGKEGTLGPWAIRLSRCGPYPELHGQTIIYDLRTKTIAQWPTLEAGYTITYLDLLPGVPADCLGAVQTQCPERARWVNVVEV